MPRQRRKNKVLVDTDSTSSCPNCQKQQQKGFSKSREYFTGLPEKATLYEYLKKPIMDVEHQKKLMISDSESEVDSAIETASITSEISSLSSDHYSSDDQNSRISSPECSNSEKTAIVSINTAYTNYENQANMVALANYYTGVPFQRFTKYEECYICEDEIAAYNEYVYQCYLDQLAEAEDNTFVVDLRGLDIGVHIEEYSDMSLVNGNFQSKINNYYVSPQGATYYMDVPLKETKELSLPRHLMIPPSERSSFDVSHPPQRPWIPLSHPERNKPVALFTVMCYNVLCDKYCTRQQYGYSPSWALHWDYRKKGILEEIRHYNADVVSLQEVETEQFYQFFQPEFEKDGYEGIFAAKSRARTMQESEAKYVDGCAIFWKSNKFKLITKELIEFNQLAIANAEGSENILNRVMTKDNIALCALLETREDIWDTPPPPELVRQQVLISTVHVIWDPEFCDVKLIQSLMLMSELKNFVENSQRSFRPGSSKVDASDMPIILCGDLNSLPDSGVVEFLANGKVSVSHLDFKDIDYEKVLNAFSHTNDNDYLTHAFNLKNAYDESIMEFTNYTYDFKGVIDYVFFSDNRMNPLGVLGPLDKQWFKENKIVGCPHPHIPSDHFSLLVEFELPATGTARSQQQPSSRR